MNDLQCIVDKLDPQEALSALSTITRQLLAHLDDEAKAKFIVDLTGEAGSDNVSSLVNL